MTSPAAVRSVRVALVLFAFSHCAALAQKEAQPAPRASARMASRPITPNDFEGSDTERINQAIAAAAGTGRRVVIPKQNHAKDGARDLWLLDSAVLVRTGTTLELENCHIKLSDQCRDNFIRSANCGLDITDITPMTDIHIVGVGSVLLEGADHPRATGDSAKTLGERTYGTDAGAKDASQTGDWRNIGILLAWVERFSIENLRIKDSHCWAISLERCGFGKVRDIGFASRGSKMIDGKRRTILNQDGVDLRHGCHDITIENITGYTGDDLVALTIIPGANRPAGSADSAMVSAGDLRGGGLDDIRRVTVRNVRGYCAGGHHIIRLLNTRGATIHDVAIDGLLDTSGKNKRCRAAIRIGDDNPKWGGVTPLGDTYRVFISDIRSRATHTVLIAGSLAESAIMNVVKYDAPGAPVTYASGREHVRQVEVTNAVTLQ